MIEQAAQRLDAAARERVPVNQGSAELSLDDAYAVQRALVSRRVGRGERVVGAKLGFTSRAKMVQMGVSDLICGALTDGMLVADGDRIDLDAYIHPRVEPEIAFLLKTAPPADASPAGLWRCVEAVAPALEIIDSRYEGFTFSVADVVADNTSASGFVLGQWQEPAVELGCLGVILAFDGRPVHIGSTAAILGHPLRALAAAGRLARRSGVELVAGSVLLAGAATAAEPLRPGCSVQGQLERLGSVGFGVAGGGR